MLRSMHHRRILQAAAKNGYQKSQYLVIHSMSPFYWGQSANKDQHLIQVMKVIPCSRTFCYEYKWTGDVNVYIFLTLSTITWHLARQCWMFTLCVSKTTHTNSNDYYLAWDTMYFLRHRAIDKAHRLVAVEPTQHFRQADNRELYYTTTETFKSNNISPLNSWHLVQVFKFSKNDELVFLQVHTTVC
jgi:hypothetical protein